MALEYFAVLDCPVNGGAYAEFHANLQKCRQGRAIYRHLRSEGKTEEEILNLEIVGQQQRQGRVESERSMRLGDMIGEIKPFMALGRRHCPECVLSDVAEPFGCYGAVNYPISSIGERWLMDQYSGNARSGESFVEHVIGANRLNGKRMKKGRGGGWFRKRQGELFESPKAFEASIQGGAKKSATISSNQLFEFLLAIGTWQPQTMLGFLKDFGVVDPKGADRAEAEVALCMLTGMRQGPDAEAGKPLDIGPMMMSEESTMNAALHSSNDSFLSCIGPLSIAFRSPRMDRDPVHTKGLRFPDHRSA